MKINGTIFSKPQQDQLRKLGGGISPEIEQKINDLDARMLNYMGDWVSNNDYHEKDVVTWTTDGNLYEVIQAHKSSASNDPDNPQYYKAMTQIKYIKHTYTTLNASAIAEIADICKKVETGKDVYINFPALSTILRPSNIAEGGVSASAAYTSGDSGSIVTLKINNGELSCDACFITANGTNFMNLPAAQIPQLDVFELV